MLNDLALEPAVRVPLPLPVAAPEEATQEDCLARAGVCRLLAGVFIEEPSAARR